MLMTKLTTPTCTDLIERPRLALTLKPLIVMTAPAGSGKTALAAQWMEKLAQQNGRFAWLSLDVADQQAVRFWQYFAKSLENATALTLPTETIESNIYQTLSDWLEKLHSLKSPFCLVLDNFHTIQNLDILAGIRFWLQYQPAMMQLIILSRSKPNLPLAQYYLEEKAMLLTAKELAFTSDEIQLYLQRHFNKPLAENTLAEWENISQGWAMALGLAKLAITQNKTLLHQPNKLFLKLNQQYLSDYFQTEVLTHLGYGEGTLLQLLRSCSLLRRIDEKLVLTLNTDPLALKNLNDLTEQGVFVQSKTLENGSLRWQIHPMLQRVLAQHCRINTPYDWANWHKLAANQWFQLDEAHEAIYHAIQIADEALIYRILQSYGWELFHQGHLSLLEQSLSYLPAPLFEQHSNLVLLKAWLAQSQHRHQEIAGILQQYQQNRPLSLSKQARFDVLRAQSAINAGDEEQAFSLAVQALKHLSKEFGYARIVAHSIVGEAQHCRGNLTAGIVQMQKVERMALAEQTHHQWLWSRLQQAEMLSAQGFLQAGFNLLQETQAEVENWQQFPMHEFLLRLQGQILWEWYQLDEAEKKALDGIEVLPNKNEQLHCMILLAKIALTRRNFSEAARLIEECRDLIQAHNVHLDWQSHFEEVQLRYWQLLNVKADLDGWLVQHQEPSLFYNHFLQRQGRNFARAYWLNGDFGKSFFILDRLLETAMAKSLVSDQQRALILRAMIYQATKQTQLAQQDLIQALNLSQQTNFISAFVIENEPMVELLRELIELKALDTFALYKAQFILRQINQTNRKIIHFDHAFVAKLLQNPHLPEVLKISPLTLREWQVLGLIYAGFSNEQIAQELVVAITTIKTHIRNLYSKIGVENRTEAIEFTQRLLQYTHS